MRTTRPFFTLPRVLICLFASLVSFSGALQCSVTAAQANSIEPTRLLEERKRFADARAQLRKGNLTQFSSISEELKDYPLYPYLDFFKHKRYISKLSLDQMDEFSRTNIDSPISYRLYNAWLASLARHQRWQDYVATYESSGKPKYDCYYYWALFKEGQTKRAFAGAEKLWLVGKSQQKACDPLFEVWKKTDAFNETIAWKRTQLAMNNRKLQLAKYLERFLAEPEKSISNEWRRVYRSPKRLQKISRYKQWSSKAKPLILSSFKRLILKETELARSLWPEYEKAFDFTPEESADVYQYFAKILALRYDDNAEYWLNQALTLPGGDVIIDYGIRHALRDHDWQRVKRWLAMTPQAERGSNQWRYWEAKANLAIEQYNTSQQQPLLFDTTAINLANEALSTFPIYDHLEEVTPYTQLLTPHISFMENLVNTNNTNALLPDSTLFLFDSQQLPKASFGELSSERSFYGFMSSEILDKPLQLNHQERVAEQEQLTRILSNPGIIRARELYQINEDGYAKSEWNLAISRMPSEDRSIAAQLADQWGWHHQAIMAAARSDIRDNLKLRFPIAFGSTVSSFANKNGIGDDWVLSLIRQESAFAFQAKSPVGALGMMQIMPATAKQVSKSIGLRYKGKRSLLSPKNNIQLGTAYMGQLLKRFQGNTILATAAYNAGPHRASRWQPKHLPMAGDIWIETIPFRETRNYVKNVMTYQAIYRAHLGQEIKLAKSLQSIPARSPRKVTTY